ncbi:sulfatase-like hydrolase/transferase [Natrinema altunense]|uniref:DUF229 domain-containing protein n=1 Tax=Natrinema altunense TaxID=222984 RepID=A0A482XVQ3_9EURY|nr:sulfatase-like hydrolase/transferase [Natrinema altunense]RZH67022.1 DUF229 domain-containing protein [Natrinema altunense]
MNQAPKNLLLFVVDSLRWDELPQDLAQRGVTFKTVAQSLYSAPSFSTLSTGLYPQEHGVARWEDKLRTDLPNIYDLPGTDGGFYQDADPQTEAMFRVLSRETATPLKSLKPPFVYLERDTSPHPPLAGFETVTEYYRSRGSNWQTIRNEYREGIETSLDRLEDRLDHLQERGLLDETLVIVTSDHGELFGEHGGVGHTAPAVPELVYVPTVFLYPSLGEDSFHADPANDIIEHVDVVETAVSLMGKNINTSGTNLLEQSRKREWGYNRIEVWNRDKEFYTADSIWGPEGGVAITRNSRIMRTIYAIYRLTRGAERHAARDSPFSLVESYLSNTAQFGKAEFSPSEAEAIIDEFETMLNKRSSEQERLDDATRDRLEELGYLDS